MFNPFSIFDPRYLPEFRKKGVIAFVQQQYSRGKNLLEASPRPAYLLSHYNDMQVASQHMDALKHDAAARLIVLNEGSNYEELQTLLHTKDALFYTRLLIKDANIKVRKLLDKKNHAYIDKKTDWQPRSYDDIVFDLDIIFGELYARFRYRGREIKIKLEELENQKDYVL